MKHVTFLAVVLVLAAGCGYQKISVPVNDTKTETLTDEQKIALLRAEAHKRGMQWRVWCVWWNENNFQAEAWRKGESKAIDSDWELHDRWMEMGTTQVNAAYKLYFAIQNEPTHPKKTPEEIQGPLLIHKNKMCPPDIRGE